MSRDEWKTRLAALERYQPAPDSPDLSALLDNELARLIELLSPYPDDDDRADMPPAVRDEVNAIFLESQRLLLEPSERMEREIAHHEASRISIGYAPRSRDEQLADFRKRYPNVNPVTAETT